MRLFVNFLAASAGGGLTYIRNVLPRLACEPGVQATAAVGRELREEFRDLANVSFLELDVTAARRFFHEQLTLPGVIRGRAADVLLSAGNFALRNSPVPQILLSRNSIYTSRDFYRDLRSRGEYRLWLDTKIRGLIARKSIQWADVTVAPSQSFADELRRWTERPIRTIPHGFDYEAFCRDATPLSGEVEEKLREAEGSVKLLFVSHYNYYRNFETLLQALANLRTLRSDRSFKLLLTCRLSAGENPGSYYLGRAVELVRELGISDMVVELGAIPYRQLHHLYKRADVYVTPAYTETFAHPLVEAMASGLPVIASDLPVHREICGAAALYFPRFDSGQLAERVLEIASSSNLAATLSARGVPRSTDFSWRKHVRELLSLAHSLAIH
jgi:glycosyltransferase involved in cell wall biosynthesis